MVKFKPWLERGCVAMQLALCLFTGLRLVSATVQGSTCALRQRLSMSMAMSSPQMTLEKPRIAPPTQRWSVDPFDASQPSSGGKDNNETAEVKTTLDQQGRGAAAGKKRSLKAKSDCHTIAKRSHKGHGQSDDDCPEPPASDYSNDVGATSPSSDGAGSSPASFLSSPTGTSDSPSGSGSASPSSSIGSSGTINTRDGTDSDNTGPPSSLTSTGNSLPGSFSSSPSLFPSPSSSDSSNLGSPPPPPVPSSLPSINYGNSKDSGTNHNLGVPPAPAPDGSSNNNLDTNFNSGSSNKTRSIAIGVSVPVGIVALGVIALFVLHRRRQRRRRRLQMGPPVEGGKKDLETANVPTSQQDPPPRPPSKSFAAVASDQNHDPNGRPNGAQSPAVTEVNSPPRLSEDESNMTHVTAPMEPEQPPVQKEAEPSPLPPLPTTPGAVGGSSDRRLSRSASRVRSQKRKPVPALLETPETGVPPEALAATTDPVPSLATSVSEHDASEA